MKTHFRLALGMVTLVVLSSSLAWGQQPGSGAPSLLPLPDVDRQLSTPSQYPVTGTPTYGQAAYAQQVAAQRFADRRFAQADPLQYDEDAPPAQDPAQPEQVPALGANGYGDGGSAGDTGWDTCGQLPTATGGRVWFGGIYGLTMTRYNDRSLCLSFDTGFDEYHVIGTEDAGMNWGGGTEVRLGSTFCGCQWGWEVGYWGIFSNDENASVTNLDTIGDLTTTLTLDNLTINGNSAFDYYDQAFIHNLHREYEFHNIELNLIRFSVCGGGCGLYTCCNGPNCGCGAGTCGPRLNVTGLAGIRYFKFREGFRFCSDGFDYEFGNDPANEMHYYIDTDNQLLGFQLGSRADFCATRKLSFFGESKFGVFGNHMSHQQSVRSGDGTYATINNGINNGEDYYVNTSRDDLAFLGELRVGATYQFNCTWSAVLAYRAMAVTGVALTADQIPTNFAALGMAEATNNDGELILHGVQAGLEARF